MNLFRGMFKSTKLEKCDPNSIPFFSFEHIKTNCKVVSFYDGDSCTIIVEQFGKFIKLKCRLKGIDTPELRSKGLEYLVSRQVRDYVSKYHSKILKVHMFHGDKYGRTLIELFDEQGSINEHLIQNNMAYRYDGKTKKTFLEWYKFK